MPELQSEAGDVLDTSSASGLDEEKRCQEGRLTRADGLKKARQTGEAHARKCCLCKSAEPRKRCRPVSRHETSLEHWAGSTGRLEPLVCLAALFAAMQPRCEKCACEANFASRPVTRSCFAKLAVRETLGHGCSRARGAASLTVLYNWFQELNLLRTHDSATIKQLFEISKHYFLQTGPTELGKVVGGTPGPTQGPMNGQSYSVKKTKKTCVMCCDTNRLAHKEGDL